MTPQEEGVIKFRLEHTLTGPLDPEQIIALNTWRDWMFRRALIGEIDTRQGKVGYGNISRRLATGFVITGSQTGHLERLTPNDYAIVDLCEPEKNRVVSHGPVKPSSEALTHTVLYQVDSTIRWVMHAHHAPIWQAAQTLGIPCTSPDAAYGTPEMAAETMRLFAETAVRQAGIFAMAGHEDGIVSFGSTPEQAAKAIEHFLEKVS